MNTAEKAVDPASMLHLRKKLFAKSNFPMFAYNIKRRITEYGQVFIFFFYIYRLFLKKS